MRPVRAPHPEFSDVICNAASGLRSIELSFLASGSPAVQSSCCVCTLVVCQTAYFVFSVVSKTIENVRAELEAVCLVFTCVCTRILLRLNKYTHPPCLCVCARAYRHCWAHGSCVATRATPFACAHAVAFSLPLVPGTRAEPRWLAAGSHAGVMKTIVHAALSYSLLAYTLQPPFGQCPFCLGGSSPFHRGFPMPHSPPLLCPTNAMSNEHFHLDCIFWVHN